MLADLYPAWVGAAVGADEVPAVGVAAEFPPEVGVEVPAVGVEALLPPPVVGLSARHRVCQCEVSKASQPIAVCSTRLALPV